MGFDIEHLASWQPSEAGGDAAPVDVLACCLAGVYQHVSGEQVGGHAIRILGWGVDNGTPYWLAANSWNTDWGDNGEVPLDAAGGNPFPVLLGTMGRLTFALGVLPGFFKILRGEDHCGIESEIVAGIPSTEQYWKRV